MASVAFMTDRGLKPLKISKVLIYLSAEPVIVKPERVVLRKLIAA